MTVSPWRLTHLWLAFISGIFLVVASITGAILSIEPIYEHTYDYGFANADTLPLAKVIQTLKSNYPEISSIKRDRNDYLLMTAFTAEGEQTFYVDPFTGKKIGDPIPTPEIFEFSRTLHRSLFMGNVGRFLVGLASAAFLFMILSGFTLILKKQGGWKNFFHKVVKDEFHRDYHTRLGKVMLLLVLIISLTGTHLFLDRFVSLSKEQLQHEVDYASLIEEPTVSVSEFEVFRETRLAQLQELQFPFSTFVDDLYIVRFDDKELLVNQYTGKIESEINYSTTKQLANFSFNLHTAEGQPWWAVLLAISSLSILFFGYSGVRIYLLRKSSSTVSINTLSPNDCEFIVLVGSETGNTFRFARAFHEALLRSGLKSYLTDMNAFRPFDSMKQLVVITSTYGAGDPPAGAARFLTNLEHCRAKLPDFQYSVVGFGSRKYPDFCLYAKEVRRALYHYYPSKELVPIKLIDNQSINEFEAWVRDYGRAAHLNLKVNVPAIRTDHATLKVIEKHESENNEDNTFTLKLAVNEGSLKGFESGDLLVYRPSDGLDRHYSMSVSKDHRSVFLSIKRHPNGLASDSLSQMTKDQIIACSFHHNENFHFPEQASHVALIANGTGIAPFLGMIASNSGRIPVSLYWGGHNEDSLRLYDPELKQVTGLQIKTAFSRGKEPSKYVQDILKEDKNHVLSLLKANAVFMICGSKDMQAAIEEILEKWVKSSLNMTLEQYRARGCFKSDCY